MKRNNTNVNSFDSGSELWLKWAMKNQITSTTLNLTDVVIEANKLLLRHFNDPSEEISKRTINYYVKRRLLPRRGGRGPGTTYPWSFVYRLVFIRLLRKRGYSLEKVEMQKVSDETMRRVALGEELLEIRKMDEVSHEEIQAARERGEQVIPIEDFSDNGPFENGQQELSPTKHEALGSGQSPVLKRDSVGPDRCDEPSFQEAIEVDPNLDARDRSNKHKSGTRFKLGSNAEFVINKKLRPAQTRQLEHIARLIIEILDQHD